jgi:hypothetical protein
MTPCEVLAEVGGLGYRLSLRPGGLHISGKGTMTPPAVKALILEHRGELIEYMEAEARTWAAHEASLAAGRITTFPARLKCYLHPSLRHL